MSHSLKGVRRLSQAAGQQTRRPCAGDVPDVREESGWGQVLSDPSAIARQEAGVCPPGPGLGSVSRHV